jgi:hypothetical protein
MPIEIRELVLKVKVNERENNGQAATDPNARRQERDASEDAIIAECVAQTLEVIAQKNER